MLKIFLWTLKTENKNSSKGHLEVWKSDGVAVHNLVLIKITLFYVKDSRYSV